MPNESLRTLKDAVTHGLAFTPEGRYLAVGKKLYPIDPKHPPPWK